jgi:hypothetical protein
MPTHGSELPGLDGSTFALDGSPSCKPAPGRASARPSACPLRAARCNGTVACSGARRESRRAPGPGHVALGVRTGDRAARVAAPDPAPAARLRDAGAEAHRHLPPQPAAPLGVVDAGGARACAGARPGGGGAGRQARRPAARGAVASRRGARCWARAGTRRCSSSSWTPLSGAMRKQGTRTRVR